MQELELRLEVIKEAAIEKDDENSNFRTYLKNIDGVKLDAKVFELQKNITSKINCLACGNCCKTFMISIDDENAERAAAFLKLSKTEFIVQYTDKGMQGSILNKIPCHFLCSNNMCSIYESRPTDCSSFPHLDKPGFQKRLLSTIDNYGVCPIVYNVFEQLKTEYQFI